MDERGFIRGSEIARSLGISTDTLRHYERKGVLEKPRRSANGYREYGPGTVERVLMIRGALRVGFSLDELARIFRIRDRGGSPCREVRALAEEKVKALDEQLEMLTSLRAELEELVKEWDAVLDRTPDGKQAGLLRLIATRTNPTRKKPTTLRNQSLKRKRG